MIHNQVMAPAGAVAVQLTATCAGCGAIVRADQAMCTICATR